MANILHIKVAVSHVVAENEASTTTHSSSHLFVKPSIKHEKCINMYL